MRQFFGWNSLLATGAIVAMAVQPAQAAITQITGVKVNPTGGGIALWLQTSDGGRPQVFTVNRGNSWVADITSTQLRLPEGNSYRQDNPTPGIASVAIVPLDANSVRVIVTGQAGTPVGQVARRESTGLMFSLERSTADQKAASTNPQQTAQATPATPAAPAVTAQNPVPLPSPTVPTSINPAYVPPTLPRAIAPPLGDIVVSNIDISATNIDLGTNERVPRLVLRDAPVREVLSLLARAAGMNVAFAENTANTAATPGAPVPATTAPSGSAATISLDIENEPVQDVFNYVLRVSNFQANRVGRTIFVGQNLPATARGLVMRTLRLNQIKATMPEVVSTTTFTSTSNTQTSGTGAGGTGGTTANSNSQVGRTSTSTQNIPLRGALQLLVALGAEGSGGGTAQTPTTTTGNQTEQVLKGLQVSADGRTNSITMFGTPRQVDIATNYLTQLDVRKRQVAVNVKIIQVSLDRTSSLSSNFSFGIGDNFFVNQAGQLDANIGRVRPATADYAGASPPVAAATTLAGGSTVSGGGTGTTGVPIIVDPNLSQGLVTINPLTGQRVIGPASISPTVFQFPTSFLANLKARITDNAAKILTDPTLIVQEGGVAQVNLTEQVLTSLQQTIVTGSGTTPQVSTTPQFADVGVILNIAVDQIDDNGFVTLAVSPEVSAPSSTRSISIPNPGGGAITNDITLISRRRLETGNLRLRDGQTLILTGIIDERQRTQASKIPILGDLPLIGGLFRGSDTTSSRDEVVVLVTPQVLDDSQQSSFGYSYSPSPEVRQILRQGEGGRP